MFTSKICLAIVLLSLHAANSYILLTANLDDVHSLAKQLASSPVANQLNDIIRRASSIFNQYQEKYDSGNKAQMRADPELDEGQSQTNGEKKTLTATEKSQPNAPEGEEPTKKIDAAPASNKNSVEVWTPDKKALAAELTAKMSDSSSGSSGESNDIRAKPHHIVRRNDPGLAELGKNASFYLKSIKKIFESI